MKEIKYLISDPRERRALEALILKDAIPVKDIGSLIGALNPRQIIFQLRENHGLRNVIKTRLFKVLDRDGKLCRPGEYFVSPEDKRTLEELLKKEATPSSEGDEMAKVSLNTTIIDGGQ